MSSKANSEAKDGASGKTYPCPECHKPMQRRSGKRGPFWGCSDFPRCRATLHDLDGKPSAEADERFRCPICTRPMIRADRDKGDYWFCSGYSKGCRTRLADQDGKPEAAYRCRDCGSLLVKREGKHGEFWGCSKYPECTASYRNKDNRPDFDFFTAKRS